MEPWVASNIIALGLLAAGFSLGIWVRGNRLWREALSELARRRPFAVAIIAVYVSIGVVDSVAWIGGATGGEDAVAAHEARTVIDRIYQDWREDSYSAPFAAQAFYGGAALT